RRAAALRESGVSVVKCAGARLDPADILAAVGEALSDRQRDPSMPGYGVLLEGGGRLAASFLKAELVDRIEWFRAPLIIGGDGLPAIADLGLAALNDARRFKLVSSEEIGDDVLDTYAVLPSA
ncbi:MAG: dihydrofolate reductase family protein, partial [Pseudomonadota bacterium]